MGFSKKAFPPPHIHKTLPHNHCLSTHRLIIEQLNNINKRYSKHKSSVVTALAQRDFNSMSFILICGFTETHTNVKSVPILKPSSTRVHFGVPWLEHPGDKKILLDDCFTLKWYLQAFYNKLSLCKNLEELLRTALCTWGKFCHC